MNSPAIVEKIKQYPVAVICAVVLLLLLVVVFMRSGVAAELALQEADLNSRIRTIDENIKNSKGLKQDTEKLVAMAGQIDEVLLKRYERAININFFYRLESDAGVIIADIAQLPTPDAIYAEGGPRKLERFSTLVYNISLTGSFTDLLEFLYQLEQADPLIRVADFYVSREGEELAGSSVEARLRVLVLAQKE